MPVKLIDPPLSALTAMKQPLTAGEWEVLNYFATNLGERWEIYVQPHLNGLRPDFILLNPRVGIVVVEVKDWDLSAMDYRYSIDLAGNAKLWGEHNGEQIFLGRSDPVSKIDVYKNALYDVFCPRLKAEGGFSTIIGVIAFPFAERAEVKAIFDPARECRGQLEFPKHNTILTLDDIAAGASGIRNVIPVAFLDQSLRFSELNAADLRHWLVEPEFSREQRVPLVHELDAKQLSVVNSRTLIRFRKIRGSAGSGKSLVLAGRAALLAAQGKRVLLVTFNITLINYLRDYVVRFDRSRKVRENIEAWNFHNWCRLLSVAVGQTDHYKQLWKVHDIDEVLRSLLAKAAVKWCADLHFSERYDAIFVDEGQDFQLDWWLALKAALKPEGEMLLAVDRTQNIYGVENWIEDDKGGSGLSSAWYELSVSYRMPEALIELANRFIQDYLPGNETVHPVPRNRSLELTPERLRWVQCHEADGVQASFDAIVGLLQSNDPILSIADLTFITDDSEVGFRIIQMLRERLAIRCIDTLVSPEFDSGAERRRSGSRRKKMAFFKGDARVKVTTVHSFKGWESSALVVFISKAESPDDLALVYAGITRLRKTDRGSQLTVVSCARQLRSFGADWPNFRCARVKRDYCTLLKVVRAPKPDQSSGTRSRPFGKETAVLLRTMQVQPRTCLPSSCL